MRRRIHHLYKGQLLQSENAFSFFAFDGFQPQIGFPFRIESAYLAHVGTLPKVRLVFMDETI